MKESANFLLAFEQPGLFGSGECKDFKVLWEDKNTYQ
jgi:hypothetical protein